MGTGEATSISWFEFQWAKFQEWWQYDWDAEFLRGLFTLATLPAFEASAATRGVTLYRGVSTLKVSPEVAFAEGFESRAVAYRAFGSTEEVTSTIAHVKDGSAITPYVSTSSLAERASIYAQSSNGGYVYVVRTTQGRVLPASGIDSEWLVVGRVQPQEIFGAIRVTGSYGSPQLVGPVLRNPNFASSARW